MTGQVFDEQDFGGKKAALICIPYGGGWSTMFHIWEPVCGPDLALLPLKLPGRGERMDEPSYEDMADLVQDCAAEAAALPSIPLYFYGGCFGGLCAYEIVRRLEQNGCCRVRGLFIHSLEVPSHIRETTALSQMPRPALAAELLRRRELPAEVLADEAVLDFLLPGIRADYHVYETYRHRPGHRLRAPLYIFGETAESPPPTEAAWAELTSGQPVWLPAPAGNLFSPDAQLHLAGQIVRQIRCLLLGYGVAHN